MKRKPRILVVGSLVMDMITSTEKFPEEGATVLGTDFSTAPGGKGANQALETCLLGTETFMVGKVGTDSFGKELISSLEKGGVNVQKIKKTSEASSAIGNVIIKTKEGKADNNRIIVIPGANMCITPEDVNYLKEEIALYDFVIIQLEIPIEVNCLVAKYAFEKHVPVMLNPAPIDEIPDDLLKHITYFSPNETEAEVFFGCPVNLEDKQLPSQTIALIRQTMKERGLEKVLITLGKAGSVIVSEKDVVYSEGIKEICVMDPTAAGDSFVGAFCTGKCCGLTDKEAMDFANQIAAVTVSGMGAQPSLPDLDRAIKFHTETGRDCDVLMKVKGILL